MATTTGERGPTLSFRLLGPLQVWRDGEPLALGGRQQRAVLAHLLTMAGHVTSLERLADAIWGDEPPTGSAATLHTYVFHLREILEPEHPRGEPWRVLLTESGGYRLEIDGSEVDATAFERAVEAGRAALAAGSYDDAAAALDLALGLWRGAVLADLADLSFVDPIATRLTDLRLFAVELHTEVDLALGRHASLLPDLDRTLEEHPLREQLHAQRILALYRSGRQSDALAAYRDLHSLLDQELGVEPSPPLRALHQAVLTQDPTLDWQPPAPPAGGGEPPVDPASPASSASSRPHRRAFRPTRRVGLASAVVAVVAVGALIAVLATRSPAPSEAALSSNAVGSVDANGALGPSVPVGNSPEGITYGDHLLWVANRSDNSVTAVDPKTGQPAQRRIRVGLGPVAVTVTGHDLWVANADSGTVSRVSTTTFDVLGDPIRVGNRPAAIASGPSGVWVANYGDDTIQRIDPISGVASAPIEVDNGPNALAVEGDSVWVANSLHDTVQEYDARTLSPGLPIPTGSGPRDIAVSATDVWVANSLSQNVTRYNRKTGRTLQYDVRDGPHSIRLANGKVWVSNEFSGSLTRIDPKNGRTLTIGVGSSPRGLAVVDGKVWVAAGAFADKRHAGGTVRIAETRMPGHFGSVDPAVVFDFTTAGAERWVYDGLVAFRAAAGSASQSLVPDLAEQIPHPSSGGTSYTFQLRSGIHYSTGEIVRASDFRRGLTRALTLQSGGESLFAGILGGPTCIAKPQQCDLSAGLLTSDAKRQVTFRLSAPDPEFPAKLSVLVFPVPAGTPLTASKQPLPGTGPYRIAAYAPDTIFTLTRNTKFAQWSFAAQPEAYPDVIDWQLYSTAAEAADAVLHGRAELANQIAASGTEIKALNIQHRAELHIDPIDQTSFERMDTTRPPFNSLAVRQAVNYAVDRRTLVGLMGGPLTIRLTCQILPPNFPSWRPDCMYTRSPGTDGTYNGPDVAQALQLVEQSGTRGMAVTIQSPPGARNKAVNRYFGQVLTTLGFRVTTRQVPDEDVYRPGIVAQMTTDTGWVADYPLPADVYDTVFACAVAQPGLAFCDQDVEELAARAHQAEGANPGKASTLWTEVDRLITRRAPVVPYGNITKAVLLATRVHNYQANPSVGPLLSQLWVN